ncbi:MAG TPA: GDSL-type esterase/lipase family protein [Cyclobacteriaceae bacterium]|nr:GDSL-type esterase/lipase family protein [Cyclobacteriaceae bacterium]
MKKIILLLLLSGNAMAQTLNIEEKVKFLALGDSYTIGQSVAVKDRWPVQLIDSIRKRGLTCYDPQIIATTGWRTDNLKSAMVSANLKNDYNLISLLIGVNNFFQGKTVESYKPEFEELLNMAIALAGGNKSHVFVVSIPDYGYTPFGQSNQSNISIGIDEFNDANKTITAKLGVSYFNITDISRRGLAEPDLVANDGLHPSGKMYTEWVERILEGATIAESHGDGGTTTPPADSTDTVTGIRDEQFGINVYPNPFNDAISFSKLPPNENLTICFMDSKGALALAKNLSGDVASIVTPQLANGLYYYRLSNSKGVIKQGRLFKSAHPDR